MITLPATLRQTSILRLLRKLREFISRFDKPKKLDDTFIFPYSTVNDIKQKQIWENLQKGLLLEDEVILIPWLTPFNQVDKYKEKRRDSGDRTEWYLGRHQILDGFSADIEVLMWMYLPWTNPITEIKSDLGYDHEGMKNFYLLKDHLETRLGKPHKVDLTKWGDLDLGTIEWNNDIVKITLVGIEHFNGRYSFHIGLVRDRNQEHLDKMIERIKARGLSIEELAK